MEFLMNRPNNPENLIKNRQKMKPMLQIPNVLKGLLLIIVLGLCCLFITVPAMAADNKSTDEIDFSKVDFSDDESTEKIDFSKQSWEDEPAEEGNAETDLSKMSWEDEPGENDTQRKSKNGYQAMSAEEEEALDIKERKIHYAGFVLFIGYILGGVLTGYYSRNRKLAVDYPPELLILLHTVWPVEWLFLLFAGKKVR